MRLISHTHRLCDIGVQSCSSDWAPECGRNNGERRGKSERMDPIPAIAPYIFWIIPISITVFFSSHRVGFRFQFILFSELFHILHSHTRAHTHIHTSRREIWKHVQRAFEHVTRKSRLRPMKTFSEFFFCTVGIVNTADKMSSQSRTIFRMNWVDMSVVGDMRCEISSPGENSPQESQRFASEIHQILLSKSAFHLWAVLIKRHSRAADWVLMLQNFDVALESRNFWLVILSGGFSTP